MATALIDAANIGKPLPNGLTDLVVGVDHIAIAVRELDVALEWYSTIFGFPLVERRVTRGDTTGMVSAVVRMAEVPIVLLQGLTRNDQVCRFIERYGPGVHHLAFRVTDIDEATSRLKARGVYFDVGPLEDGGIKQTFLARTDGSGMRLELVERSEVGFSDSIVERLFREFERRDLI